jgi:hypothetical protein
MAKYRGPFLRVLKTVIIQDQNITDMQDALSDPFFENIHIRDESDDLPITAKLYTKRKLGTHPSLSNFGTKRNFHWRGHLEYPILVSISP